jgi:membrane fusion protein (multidrug efflux system)
MDMTMRAGRILASLAILAAIGAGGAYWYVHLRPPAEGPAAMPAPAAGPAVAVEATPVEIADIELTIPAVGSLRSHESVTVSPEIGGRVAEILVTEGEAITAGTRIATLDQSVYLAELARAEASLSMSSANLKRAIDLLEKKVGTARAKDEAEAAWKADEAAIALARARLDKTVITAPFDGILGLRSVSVGQYIEPGDAIIKIEDIDPLKVDFRVPEIYFAKVRVGQPIKLTIDALQGAAVAGKVFAIDPLIDVAGRSIVIRAELPNGDFRLRPGLFARVTLVYDTIEDAILVPEESVIPIGGDTYVFRVVDGKAARARVELGERFKGRVQVAAGLSAGDLVVTAGQLKIQDGMAVSVQPANDAGVNDSGG